nr:39S ribosomal protein L10, mitochondrial [Leptinotarsa decemlineata]
MALVPKRALLERIYPLIQVKRFRGKINVTKPKPPHFVKASYLALTKPWFINPNKDKKPMELCRGFDEKLFKDDNDNPFQRIIAQELYRWISTSRLVVFYHHNPMNAEEEFKAFAMFKKQNMHFKKYGKKTLQMAVEGTPYETILDFYCSQNMTVFSPEPEIVKMLNITKKFRQLVLLAGILDGKFVSKDDLIKYSAIPNLQTAQVGLVQTLNSAASRLVGQLSSPQGSLVSNLEERAKQLQLDNKR